MVLWELHFSDVQLQILHICRLYWDSIVRARSGIMMLLFQRRDVRPQRIHLRVLSRVIQILLCRRMPLFLLQGRMAASLGFQYFHLLKAY